MSWLDNAAWSTTSAERAQWLRAVYNLARRAGRTEDITTLTARVEELGADTACVALIGSPNCGKSGRVNAIVGRALLPVGPLPSLLEATVQACPKGSAETCAVDGVPRPLDTLRKAAPESTAHAELAIDNVWLRRAAVRLVERRPGEEPADALAMAGSMLRDVDLAVIVMDSLMPFTRTDALLLGACATAGVPLVVVLSKVDQLPPEEHGGVLEYVVRQLEALSLAPEIVETAVAGDRAEGIESLRVVIQVRTAGDDLARVRFHRFRGLLLETLEGIALAAHAVVDRSRETAAERAAEASRGRQRLDEQNLVWMQLEQELSLRRQRLDDQLRAHLMSTREAALESLFFELEKTNDVRQWWQKDLPFRLQRELRGIAGQLSGMMTRQSAADVRWLQEELHRRFRYPLVATVGELALSPDAPGPEPPLVNLANMQVLRVISRVGIAGTILLVGTTLAKAGSAGLGGVTMAVSALAGLAAEQITQRLTAKDRAAVRGDLDKVIHEAWLAYAAAVSEKLREGYGAIAAAVRQEQQRWREAQTTALQAPAPAESDLGEWQAILDESAKVAAEIRAYTPAADMEHQDKEDGR
jgi:GTP-binding protein EngB required for normal cell division